MFALADRPARTSTAHRTTSLVFRETAGHANGEQKSASWSLGSVHPRGTAMVDCSLVVVALVELFVVAQHAALDLLSLVLLPAVLESSAVLLHRSDRRGMALQLLSWLVPPYAEYALSHGCGTHCSAPPGRISVGRSHVCRPRVVV